MTGVTFKRTKLDRFRQQLRPNIVRAVDQTTADIQRDMQQFVAKDSYELHDSITRTGEGLQQGVIATADHAFAQEFGRPDLDERASARAESTGDDTPGYTYTPYARPAAEKYRPKHRQRVTAAIRRSAR